MIVTNKEEGDAEETREESAKVSTPRMNAAHGFCSICHLTIANTSTSHHQSLSCPKGHILCHRCVQQFAVQSDSECILCCTQIQRSSTSFSRESITSTNSVYVPSKRTQLSQQEHYYRERYQPQEQQVPVNVEGLYVKPWIHNYPRGVSSGDNESENDEVDNSEMDFYGVRNEHNGRDDTRERELHSYCNLVKKQSSDSYVSEIKINGQITLECSRRPIRCPRIDCAINVAFSALTHHFIFDHPEVPILSVEPGIKSTLIVSFGALASNSSRCLALLLVSGKLSDPVARLFNGTQINPKYRNRLPLPVLAARLSTTNQYISSEQVNNETEERDVIIAWVAGLDIGHTKERLRCSIQAVDNIDNRGLRSLTYTGPVNSLRTAQRPRDVFLTGDCIVLHEGLLQHITSDYTNLNVNVIVH